MDLEERLSRLEALVQELVRSRPGPAAPVAPVAPVAPDAQDRPAPDVAGAGAMQVPLATATAGPGGTGTTNVSAGARPGGPGGTVNVREELHVGHGRQGPPPPPRAEPEPAAPRPARDGGLGEVLARFRAPGRRVVCAGVGHWETGSSRTATNVMCYESDDPVRLDQRRTAALCQALASEPRLSMLCELLAGPRSTSDLTTATALDRGQLYHHLRDLFLQGLVEQPERGRYRLTDRGETVVLLTAVLATSAPEAEEPFTLAPEDVEDGGSA